MWDNWKTGGGQVKDNWKTSGGQVEGFSGISWLGVGLGGL